MTARSPSEKPLRSVPNSITPNTGAGFRGTDRIFSIRTGTGQMRNILPTLIQPRGSAKVWNGFWDRSKPIYP